MANPERGEVDFDFNGKRYVLKFNNAGRRVVEEELGLDAPEITARLVGAVGRGAGPRIFSALFFGATRKYHARDFPVPQTVDLFMDSIEEADDEAENSDNQTELAFSLMAAFLRQPKQQLKDALSGSRAEPEDSGAVPKAESEEEIPPAEPETEIPSLPRSEAGKSS